MLTPRWIAFIICGFLGFGPVGSAAETASDPFRIPADEPETVITAQSLELRSGLVYLLGKVKAVRGSDLLTCEKAMLRNKPQWLLASQTPRLYRKETLPDKMVIRESLLESENILWEQTGERVNASPSVTMKLEERSWDLATYTWAIISADEMEGFRSTNQLHFTGNVKLRDKSRFGEGQRLDYDRNANTAVLSGNARVETEEWSAKEKKMIKRIITGAKITYNMKTKEAMSE